MVGIGLNRRKRPWCNARLIRLLMKRFRDLLLCMAEPAQEVHFSPGDPEELRSLMRRSTMRKSLVERSGIIIVSSEGRGVTEIAQQLGVVRVTVFKWQAVWRHLAAGKQHTSCGALDTHRGSLIVGSASPSAKPWPR